MQAADIRQRYLDFFQSKGHLLVPSSSLIPAGDPTLLLTTAGMVQFKPYFTGEMQPPRPRLTSVQKCFRVTDVESVGDASHLTFFEMLGNFSIGDYFKREAIAWAWEFVTQHLKLPPDRLWATVFLDDDEALELWVGQGVPRERIRRLGEKDNFWGPAGEEGPCGPCSEIHYDRGGPCRLGKPDNQCGPGCDCGRFLEIWNLVFMQFYQDKAKKRTPLPKPNIDTGMGLERVACLLQGVPSVYETDLFQPIIARVCELANKRYGQDEATDRAIRVVAEHARSAAFLIADGVVPGNAGRGYVLRRLIRRAILFGQKIGLAYNPDNADSFLAAVAEVVIQRMGGVYSELAQGRTFVLRVLQQEEAQFTETFNEGLPKLEKEIIPLRRRLLGVVDRWDELYRYALNAHVRNLHTGEEVSTGDSLAVAVNMAQGELAPIETEINRLIEEGIRVGISEGTRSLVKAISNSVDQFRDKLVHFRIEPGNISLENALQAHTQALRALAATLPGTQVFILHDTYGFPVEVTAEVAQEHGLSVDMEGFQREMEAQRQRARAASGFGGDTEQVRVYQELSQQVGSSRSLAYEATSASSVIAAILVNGEQASAISAGQQAEVVLQETPFYAEGGGQVGDAGFIQGPDDSLFHVEDTQAPIPGLVAHTGRVLRGSLRVGEHVLATVEEARRNDAARNHTATHLLHAALRKVLGTHVRQQGSLVTPDRLRFDFTHVSAVSPQELRQVEEMVNDRIRANLPVRKRETTYRQAVAEGALAFFGERYGDRVRVVEVGEVGAEIPAGERPRSNVGDALPPPSQLHTVLQGSPGGASLSPQPFSFEVCGGTHINATGEIGLCLVLGESSVGAGLRRIEAVTGRAAEALLREQQALIAGLAQQLEASPKDLPAKIEALKEENARLRKEAEARERAASLGQAQALLGKATQVNGVTLVSGGAAVSSAEALREIGDWLRDKLSSGVVCLGAVIGDRPVILVMATKDVVARGVHAGNMVREAAKAMGGGGGGRPEMAQGGGRDAAKLDDALRAAQETLRGQVKG
ncbi:MAG: alanine--tRNA ligase [Chloroflexi bacterium]|nr:alanine--tRNA ligase [Chloroflexota bacterium]